MPRMRYQTVRVCLFLGILAMGTTSPAFSAGTREQDFKAVNGAESWDYRYDISTLPPGKYNILVQGTDKAGNVSVAGPYNIYVDPKSDLPVVSVSTPFSGQRVGGDLTVVGTAVDDDGVGRVEVSVDKAEYAPADGKDFWTWSFPVGSIADGPHTVSARAVDVNGLAGVPVTVKFNLDTRAPVIRMTSAESGVLAGGTLALAGTAEDLNGVKSMSVSTNDRASFQPLGIKTEQGGIRARFSMNVDTRKLKDGPHVYWFRALDRTGSVGTLAFLFFVDNTGPVVQVLSPAPTSRSPGKVTVVGKLTELVGIKSLSWNAGEAGAGEVPLTPGDPYWTQDIDFSKSKGSSARVVFTAVDRAGNRTVAPLEVGLSAAEADLPVLALRSPSAAARYGASVPLAGSVRDDDGAAAIAWSLDGKAPVRVDTAEAFSLLLPDVAPGKHRLAVHGIDVNGTPGKDVVVDFVSTGTAGAVSMDTVTTGNGTAGSPFQTGVEIDRHRPNVLHGRVITPARIASISVTFNGAGAEPPAIRQGPPGQTLFDVKVPPAVPFGVVVVDVTARDEYGQAAEQKFLLHVTNTSRRVTEPGLQFFDARIRADGTVALGPDGVLAGILAGEEIASVALEPATDLVSVSSDGDRILVRAARPGASEPVRVKVVTKKGHSFFSEPWRFVTDSEDVTDAPRVALASLVRGKDTRDYSPGMMLELAPGELFTGTITGTVKTAEYSLAGAAARPLPVRKPQKAGPPSAFDLPLSPDLPYGRTDIRISVTDESGRRGDFQGFFYRVDPVDAAGAVSDEEGISFADSRIGADGAVLLAPRETLEGYYNGRPVTQAVLEPQTPVLSVSFVGNRLILAAAEEGLDAAVRLRITTADGDTIRSGPLSVRVDAAPPELTVSEPHPGAWTGSRFVLTGTATDTGGPVTVEYSPGGDAGPFVTAPVAAGAFQAAVDLAGIPDGDVQILVRARDAAGRLSTVSVPVSKDTEAPVLTQLTPSAEDPVNGIITVSAAAADAGLVDHAELTTDGTTWTAIPGTTVVHAQVDLSKVDPAKVALRVTDRGGNSAVFSPVVNRQQAADVPVVDIQAPQDGDIQRADFVVSGTALDDDGIGAILYRVDGGEWARLPGAATFSIPLALADLADNEHTVDVKAEDLNGVPSEPLTRTLRVSRAEPASRLVSPPLATTSRGIIDLGGQTVDKNGVAEVFLSFDNGQTFQRAEGKDSWTYRLDTRVLKDGTYSVFIRAVDSYGTVGLASTLVSVDNTAPEIVVDEPRDGAAVSGSFTLAGRDRDDIAVSTMTASIRPLGSAVEPARIELPAAGPFSRSVDVSRLPAGWYDLSIEGVDRATNSSDVSRNLLVQPSSVGEHIDILFPANGETLHGQVAVSGRLNTVRAPQAVTLLVDGKEVGAATMGDDGYFAGTSAMEGLPDGVHQVTAEARFADGGPLDSEPRSITWAAAGPWVRLTSHALGAWVRGRPFLAGEAGSAPDAQAAAETDPGKKKRAAEAHRPVQVLVSMDNGRTFAVAQGTEKWRWRLETQNLADGPVRIMVKALFVDGATAVEETILRLDDTAPQVRLLEPPENGRFNGEVNLAGTAADENGVEQVRAVIRKGDKSSYEVPGFIQGLYLDAHVLGATDWDMGAGLTFFDQNVKLQAQVGMAPEGRFSGLMIGAKLLANIARLPFNYVFGPDLDFLSASFAVGANFSYATNTGTTLSFDQGVILGAVVAQLEFPIFKVKGWTAFNTWSTYTEYQLWFISSDVSAGVVNRLAFGVRIGLL